MEVGTIHIGGRINTVPYRKERQSIGLKWRVILPPLPMWKPIMKVEGLPAAQSVMVILDFRGKGR